ncbi:MAG: hypothetical protein OXC61_10365 [Flavobacteriaceae bacterium]|nr:hypothetical protein [Flavobacteriaceae bacterium]
MRKLFQSNRANAVSKVLCQSSRSNIQKEQMKVTLKKKRNLSILLEIMNDFKNLDYPLLGNKKSSGTSLMTYGLLFAAKIGVN